MRAVKLGKDERRSVARLVHVRIKLAHPEAIWREKLHLTNQIFVWIILRRKIRLESLLAS